MKNRLSILIIAALTVFCTTGSFAQKKVSEKDILGTWKMVIDLDEAFDEAKEDMEEEDSFLGEIFIDAISGIVTNALDEVDIFLEFKKDGQVIVDVYAFDEEEENELTTWRIENGKLYIEDSDNFSTDSEEDYWLIDNNVLLSYDENGDLEENIYLVRLD